MHHSIQEEPGRFGVELCSNHPFIQAGQGVVLGAVSCCRVPSFPPPADLHHLQQDQGVVCAEAPKSSEHPNARGAAEGDSGFPWHGAGRCCSELLLNLSPLALRYVVCAGGVLAGWELPAQLAGEGSWVWLRRWNCSFGSGFGQVCSSGLWWRAGASLPCSLKSLCLVWK